jgi:hypothetical protein
MRPYLADAPLDVLHKRFDDIQHNITSLRRNGCVSVVIDDDLNCYWLPRLRHIFEECKRRGVLYDDMFSNLHSIIPTYPNPPKGAEYLSSISRSAKGCFLAKFTKRTYAERLFYNGELRIAPASYYNDSSLNCAIQDDELKLCTFIPKGEVSITLVKSKKGIENSKIPVTTDVKKTTSLKTNYFVWCSSLRYDIRLFHEFEYDSCIIIHNPSILIQRINSEMKRLVNWSFYHGCVEYIDPYLCLQKEIIPSIHKHFRYKYQEEYRFVWYPSGGTVDKLEPLILNIGPLDDICELVVIDS